MSTAGQLRRTVAGDFGGAAPTSAEAAAQLNLIQDAINAMQARNAATHCQ